MGHGASVPRPSPQTVATLRSVSTTALSHAKRAALLASVHLASATRQAERWYAVADERVLRKVHNAVETHMLTRVRRLADEAEVASKLWFVKSISTTSIADAFGIDIQDVSQVQIAKHQYEVYNCGPELLNVPTLNKAAAHVLELRDPQITEFLLRKCLWTTWKPPASWRMKVDQVFDVTVHVDTRRDGFRTGDTRVIKMRVGKKWVGPHHHNSECHVPFEVKSQWLHRVDYEIEDKTHPKNTESAFYQTATLAWANYMDELSKLPKEDLRSSEEAGNGFSYEEQDRPTHLRIKYLLATSLEKILNEKGTLFRVSSQFELWCMAQEDSERHRMDAAVMSEDHFAGPLLDTHIEELVELFEAQAMEMEDVKILELMLPVATRPEEEEEQEQEQDGDKGQPSDSHSEATGDDTTE